MIFVHILPTAFINNKDCQTSNTQLILAHLLKDEEYLKECRKFKGVKILDNSFFEMRLNPFTVDDLIELAKKSSSQVICLPDTSFKDEEQFYKAHKEMARKVKKAGFKVMACVTCDKSFERELEEFKILNSIQEIDIVSIPYVFRRNGDALKRWVFLDMIEEKIGMENLKKEYHLFGCNSFHNLRIENRKWITSVDSTMPLKEGYFRTPLPININQQHQRPKDYFKIKKLDKEQLKLVKYNIKMIQEICNGNSS